MMRIARRFRTVRVRLSSTTEFSVFRKTAGQSGGFFCLRQGALMGEIVDNHNTRQLCIW